MRPTSLETTNDGGTCHAGDAVREYLERTGITLALTPLGELESDHASESKNNVCDGRGSQHRRRRATQRRLF